MRKKEKRAFWIKTPFEKQTLKKRAAKKFSGSQSISLMQRYAYWCMRRRSTGHSHQQFFVH